MKDLVASELRTLRRHIAEVNRRVAMTTMPGKVKPGSQNLTNRTVRLILGTTEDGQEVLSPPVRWQEQGAGRVKIHSVPADNEQMDLLSPSGTVGKGSKAIRATYDNDHEAPSKLDSEMVLTFDDGTTLTIEKERTRLQSKSVHVDAETVTLGGEGGKKVARVGDRVRVSRGSSSGLWPIIEGSDHVTAI